MSVLEYLETIKARLLSDPIVAIFQVIRERGTTTDGYIRARITLSDNSLLEFSEYFQQTPEGNIQIVTYSYHWADESNRLIRRWDDTPHHPNLPGFPHHLHDGAKDTVEAGRPMSIFAVLDEIGQQLNPQLP